MSRSSSGTSSRKFQRVFPSGSMLWSRGTCHFWCEMATQVCCSKIYSSCSVRTTYRMCDKRIPWSEIPQSCPTADICFRTGRPSPVGRVERCRNAHREDTPESFDCWHGQSLGRPPCFSWYHIAPGVSEHSFPRCMLIGDLLIGQEDGLEI